LAPAVLSRRGLFRGLVAVGGLAAGAWTSTSSAQPSGPRALLAEEQQALSAVLNKLIDKSRVCVLSIHGACISSRNLYPCK
jgi:hypothetical protein